MGVKTRNLSNTVGLDIEWQGVQTGNFTAVAGKGYFVDTTNAAITVTLPGSPSQGDTVVFKDYARTWATNNLTTSSALFDGITSAIPFTANGQTITLVYMDGTKGWSLINEDTVSVLNPEYIAATGGTVATSGDYKIHTFTGDGCFVVSCGGNSAGSNSVDYLVVAGGAGGGAANGGGGGGGAGGLRYSASTYCNPAPAPSAGTALPVSATTYPVTVGGGGGGGSPEYNPGSDGSNSVFSTITSAGGGGGGGGVPGAAPGRSGGSGGGGSKYPTTGGSGNTPPTSPPQGNPGGPGDPAGNGNEGGGGGGASAAGRPGNVNNPCSGDGGDGYVVAINGSCTAYGGGGGGQVETLPQCGQGQGGLGGGGTARVTAGGPGFAGTANTGGGGGGVDGNPSAGSAGAGGKGIVIIRYKFQ